MLFSEYGQIPKTRSIDASYGSFLNLQERVAKLSSNYPAFFINSFQSLFIFFADQIVIRYCIFSILIYISLYSKAFLFLKLESDMGHKLLQISSTSFHIPQTFHRSLCLKIGQFDLSITCKNIYLMCAENGTLLSINSFTICSNC